MWFKGGEASGYDVVCKDGTFSVHETCVYFSEFLYDQHQARKKYNDKNNKKFKLEKFRKESIKMVFDFLYGISTARMNLEKTAKLIGQFNMNWVFT